MKASVTTVIPTYRRPRLLARAIRSALNQSHAEVQVLVCDNDSGDNTPEVVAEFAARDPRVRYLRREKNLGVYENMRLGLEAVETPYCSFLSDDDVMLPDYYRATLPGLVEHPDAAFSAGRTLLMIDDGTPVSVMPGFRTRAAYYTPPRGILPLLSGHMVSHYALTGVLLQTGIARELWPLKVEEGYPLDIELMLRMTGRYSYVLCDEIVMLICLHPENLLKPRVPLYRGWLRVLRDLAASDALPEPQRSLATRKFFVQLKNAYTKIWLRCVASGNWPEAYILAEILGEEFQLDRLSGILFRATQSFRKFPESDRWSRLKETLRRRDDLYKDRFFGAFEQYAKYFKDS